MPYFSIKWAEWWQSENLSTHAEGHSKSEKGGIVSVSPYGDPAIPLKMALQHIRSLKRAGLCLSHLTVIQPFR